MVIFLHELKQYLQKRYEGPLNIDELPDFLRNFVKNFTKKGHFSTFFGRFWSSLEPQFRSKFIQNDNCSPRFKLRSSKKVWQAFVVDYLPDSLLQLLETFSNVFFYTFCQFLTPNLTRNIVQLLMKRKFLPELCQYYLEYAKNLAPLIFYLL